MGLKSEQKLLKIYLIKKLKPQFQTPEGPENRDRRAWAYIVKSLSTTHLSLKTFLEYVGAGPGCGVTLRAVIDF
jgi:hypothetical protein